MFNNGKTHAETTRLDSPEVSFGQWCGMYTDKAGNTTERKINADRLMRRIRRTLGKERARDAGHVLSLAWCLWVESGHRYGAGLLLRFAIGAYWREHSDGRPADEVPDYVYAKRRRKRTLRNRRFVVDAFATEKERQLIGTLLECEGSYTKAARLLGITQPAVSQRVKTLGKRYVLAEVSRYAPERASLRRMRLSTLPKRLQEERTEAGAIARETFHREAGTLARRARNARKAANTFAKRPSGTVAYVIDGHVYYGRKAD